MRSAVLLLISLMSGICSITPAQDCTIRGSVVDEGTGRLLEYVNVFLAGTTSGTSTDEHGAFLLSGIPPGGYDIVISRVGYQRVTRQVALAGADSLEFAFHLKRKDLQTEEMQVSAPDPSEWRRLLKIFTTAFLGQTDNARLCTIRNPYQLDLHYDEARSLLTARCDSPLVVENRALGYLIVIEIDQFEFDVAHEKVQYSLYPRFEPLDRRADDSAAWQGHRENTYRGSMKHFLKSAIAGALDEEMFAVFTGSLDELSHGYGVFITAEDLNITQDPSPGIFQIAFPGWIRIEYRVRIPGAANLLTLHAPYIRVDRDGNVLTRYGVEAGGSWARCGVADFLPMH